MRIIILVVVALFGTTAAFAQSVSSAFPVTVSTDTSIGVGANSSAAAANSTAFGVSATVAAAENSGTAVGKGAVISQGATGGGENIAVGSLATAMEWRATAVGYKASASAVSATAFGRGALASAVHSIAIGRGAWMNAANSIAIGFSGGNSATDVFFESGHTSKYVDPVDGATVTRIPSSTPIVIHGFDAYDATGSPTNNVAGGPLQLVGGRGTGTAVGGDVSLQVAPASGGSNNTKNTLAAALTALAVSGRVQLNKVEAAAPAAGDCDAAGETGTIAWDSTADNLYICSGASGWRKIVTAAP